MIPHRVVETITRFTPLGIRFWDPALSVPVRDGLRVTLRREGASEAETTAFRTRSGVYAFQDIPGLRSVENGDAPMYGPDVIAIQQRYIIDISDTEARYVPTALALNLPREDRGVYPPTVTGSFPGDFVPGVFLFSAVTRPVTLGHAVLYADLVDVGTLGPARHAALEILVDGSTHYGISDGEGRAAVVFPYPPMQVVLEGSFPEGRTPLSAFEWDVTVRIRYQPRRQVFPPSGEIPLIGSLFEQDFALLHPSAPTASDPIIPDETLTATLLNGRPVVLRSLPDPVLYIEPISSIQ
jgi:hypothetical protein